MMRDMKSNRRNRSKSANLDEIENIPVSPNTIDQDQVGLKTNKFDKTPTKPSKIKCSDGLKTPGNRFGWPLKNESCSTTANIGGDLGTSYRNMMTTPRSNSRGIGRGNNSIFLECNSIQCTPSKSVSKPPNPGLCLTGGGHRLLPPGNGGARVAHFGKGVSGFSSALSVVDSVEVQHFDMKEDAAFWMDHNVQVTF